tara:strand:+ start:177 stop:437 length:261 start_codon:yes stop_codon:yes gene_type:complete
MIPMPIDTSRLNYENVQKEKTTNTKFKILIYIIFLFVILSHPYFTIFINNIYYYFMKLEYIYHYEWSILSALFLGCLFASIIFISF